MDVEFSARAWADFLYWVGNDTRMLKRLVRVIEDARRDPFSGIGKPEPLRGNLSGLWSRRIDREHRLVYAVNDETLLIHSCRYHYDRNG